MMTLLGMTGFSSNWIEGYAIKTEPLREIKNEANTKLLSAPLKWILDAKTTKSLLIFTNVISMQLQC